MKKFVLFFAVLLITASAHADDKRMSGAGTHNPIGSAAEATAKGAAQLSHPILEGDPKAKKPAKAASKTPVAVVAKTETAKVEKNAAKAPLLREAVNVTPVNYTGEIETYRARGDDTLQSIGEREDLGYVELRSANPAMDPWRPGAGTFIILPQMHLLPDAPRKGIVVNLSEMRVYYFQPNGQIKTFPIGVGREGFSTPVGQTRIERKVKGPSWTPTPRMLREDPTLKPFYGPGPDNPLGDYALYLGWPEYRLHGTNKPWGIGRRVSSGCIRMYNASAEYLFENVPVGTTVTTVKQAIKFAWIGNMLYIEAHPDGGLADQVERVGGAPLDYKVPSDIFANLSKAAGNARDKIDWKAVREALRDRRGYPVPILQGAGEGDMFVKPAMVQRAGTERSGVAMTEDPQPEQPQAAAVSISPAQQPPAQTAAPAQEPAPAAPRVRRSMSGFNG